MVEVSRDEYSSEYQHPVDNSFIAYTVNRIERGVQRGAQVDVFEQLPRCSTELTAPEQPPAATVRPTRMRLPNDPASLPDNWLEWMRQGVRAAWLPYFRQEDFSTAQVVRVLQALGFSPQPPEAAPQTWTVSRLWQQWSLDPASVMPCENPTFRVHYGLGSPN